MSRPMPIVILGASGEGKCLIDFIGDINAQNPTPKYELLGFLDDNKSFKNSLFYGYPVLGTLGQARQWKEAKFINTIAKSGNLGLRAEIYERIGLNHDRYETIVHPRSYVSNSAMIGHGCVIYPNTTVGPSARLGNHILALFGANISHDSTIGDFVVMAGGAQISGHCNVGESSYIGTAASIRERITVSSNILVGMGSVVVHDALLSGVYAGVPARKIQPSG